jgi:NTE family protein
LLARALPSGVTTFGQCQTQLYTTATDLRTSRLYVFGDKADAPLLDAVTASATIPAIHPPISYAGAQLVDGGVVANVPVSVAIDRGATTIYVINAGFNEAVLDPAQGVLEVLMRTLSTMLAQNIIQDIARAKADAASICITSRCRPTPTSASSTSANPRRWWRRATPPQKPIWSRPRR